MGIFPLFSIGQSFKRSQAIACQQSRHRIRRPVWLSAMLLRVWMLILILLAGCAQPTATAPPPSLQPLASPTRTPPPTVRVSPSVTPTIQATRTATNSPTPTATSTVAPRPARLANPIVELNPLPNSGSGSLVEENKKPGTGNWYAIQRRADEGEIAGFANATSVNVGETIYFAISTAHPGELFSLEIYRLGWYGGSGGNLVAKANGLQGQAQGYWSLQTIGVADCPSCVRDDSLGLLDTHWQYGYSLTIPTDWISGEYQVILTAENGMQGLIFFVVRQDQRLSDLLVQMPILTRQAYSSWGGDSLYEHDPNLPPGINGGKAAVKVSFNRPYAPYLIYEDIQAIHFFEKYGYDVTYATSIDIDRDASILKGHRAFISAGHDEYWTRQMRLNVEQARDNGLNLAFLGGNDVYWQARLEADSDGNPRRVMVMYREGSLDPLSQTDPTNVTVQFIQPPVNWPQNSLTGTIFGGIIEQPPGLPWVVAPTAPAWMLAGTGLAAGSTVPALTGKECDSVADNGYQPASLVIVAASPMITKQGLSIICNSTYYTTSSGSAVFNAGTLSWLGSMDSSGYHNPGQKEEAAIVQLTINVLTSFGANKGK